MTCREGGPCHSAPPPIRTPATRSIAMAGACSGTTNDLHQPRRHWAPTAPQAPKRLLLPCCRLIFVSNHLPLKVSRGETGWNFEWDEDALIAQAKEGLPEEMEALYVGCLPVEVDSHEQEVGGGGLCS
jgi:hypothetical protein